MILNSKKCIHMEIKNTTSYGIGEETTYNQEYLCKKKDMDLYQKLFEMGYESSFYNTTCPFFLYPNKIEECPFYKEK